MSYQTINWLSSKLGVDIGGVGDAENPRDTSDVQGGTFGLSESTSAKTVAMAQNAKEAVKEFSTVAQGTMTKYFSKASTYISSKVRKDGNPTGSHNPFLTDDMAGENTEVDADGLPVSKNWYYFNPQMNRWDVSPDAPLSVKEEYYRELQRVEAERTGETTTVAPPPPPPPQAASRGGSSLHTGIFQSGRAPQYVAPPYFSVEATTALPPPPSQPAYSLPSSTTFAASPPSISSCPVEPPSTSPFHTSLVSMTPASGSFPLPSPTSSVRCHPNPLENLQPRKRTFAPSSSSFATSTLAPPRIPPAVSHNTAFSLPASQPAQAGNQAGGAASSLPPSMHAPPLSRYPFPATEMTAPGAAGSEAPTLPYPSSFGHPPPTGNSGIANAARYASTAESQAPPALPPPASLTPPRFSPIAGAPSGNVVASSADGNVSGAVPRAPEAWHSGQRSPRPSVVSHSDPFSRTLQPLGRAGAPPPPPAPPAPPAPPTFSPFLPSTKKS